MFPLTFCCLERGNDTVLAEYGTTTSSFSLFDYIYTGDTRIAMRKNSANTLHYYLNDHLGSTRLVIDSVGLVKDNLAYLAFGDKESETVSTGQDFKYMGKPFDADGGLNLYYYGARYYDAVTGRFAAVDPLQSKYPAWSPYVYTNDNPLKYIDPDGEFVVTAGALIVASLAVLSTPDYANAPTSQEEVEYATENYSKTEGEKFVEIVVAVTVIGTIVKAVQGLITPDNPTDPKQKLNERKKRKSKIGYFQGEQ